MDHVFYPAAQSNSHEGFRCAGTPILQLVWLLRVIF
jgi:hypothetical protein